MPLPLKAERLSFHLSGFALSIVLLAYWHVKAELLKVVEALTDKKANCNLLAYPSEAKASNYIAPSQA